MSQHQQTFTDRVRENIAELGRNGQNFAEVLGIPCALERLDRIPLSEELKEVLGLALLREAGNVLGPDDSPARLAEVADILELAANRALRKSSDGSVSIDAMTRELQKETVSDELDEPAAPSRKTTAAFALYLAMVQLKIERAGG